ncbi:MAG: HipA domain-containing protein [Betaproteobacteria bacterium]|nr:HipA domain-containing protein [Betaproteobacteria bacterium]
MRRDRLFSLRQILCDNQIHPRSCAGATVKSRRRELHLKNFGLLYTHPGSDDCRLSPRYDIVCTAAFIPKDVPALSVAEQEARRALNLFGREVLRVKDLETAIDRMLSAA